MFYFPTSLLFDSAANWGFAPPVTKCPLRPQDHLLIRDSLREISGLGSWYPTKRHTQRKRFFSGSATCFNKIFEQLGPRHVFCGYIMLKQILFKRCVCEPLLDFLPKGTSCAIWSTNCSSRDEVFAPIQVLVSECCRGSVVDTGKTNHNPRQTT